jgi:hypothetical protein
LRTRLQTAKRKDGKEREEKKKGKEREGRREGKKGRKEKEGEGRGWKGMRLFPAP